MITNSHNATATVDHPDHYNKHPSGVECIDIVEHFPFNVGNTIKYLWRAGLKVSAGLLIPAATQQAFNQDLQKAHWYLTRELELRGIKPTYTSRTQKKRRRKAKAKSTGASAPANTPANANA